MSISYHIYNSEEGFENMSSWDSDHFVSIGSPEDVILKLERLFSPRELSWEFYESPIGITPYIGTHSCLASKNCHIDEEYIDLSLKVHKKGYVCEVAARKGSPYLVRKIMEGLHLKWVFVFESMKLIDPYQYEGNWVKTVEKY